MNIVVVIIFLGTFIMLFILIRSSISRDVLDKLTTVTGVVSAIAATAVFLFPNSAQTSQPSNTTSDLSAWISVAAVIFSIVLGVSANLITNSINKYRESRRKRRNTTNQQELIIYQSIDKELFDMVKVVELSELQHYNKGFLSGSTIVERHRDDY